MAHAWEGPLYREVGGLFRVWGKGGTVRPSTKEATVADMNQVRPNYGAQPRGKANIMRQGQTENAAYGQDPNATGNIGPVKDNPNLGSGV